MVPTKSQRESGGTLYGVPFEEWLRIRDERDHYERILRRIVYSPGSRLSFKRWAAEAVRPGLPFELARVVLTPFNFGRRARS